VSEAKARAKAHAEIGEKAAQKALQGLSAGTDITGLALDAVSAGAPFSAIVTALSGDAVTVAKLPKRHLADSFERLRDASIAFEKKTGRYPAIFLAHSGPVAKHTGRATFAKNFFEAGGIQAISNNGFSEVEACVAAFKESGAKIVVICSSDGLYEEMVPTFAPALKAAGAETVYLAGAPGDKKDAYDAAGVNDYIFMGAEVLGKLTAQLIRLGVIAQ
ncbi:MAG: methylmalonyl-CoA mutase, partial [Rhodospirillaceae bacterium]|nr:methylmalonyl-CoA mutase [Rhodospirillaceae bacterium]